MSNATQTQSTPIPLGFRWLGVGLGIAAAAAGIILFGLFFPLVIDFPQKFGSADYFESLRIIFLLVAVFGIMFSILPATFGGVYLAVLIERDAVKKRLTIKRVMLRGAMAGGIAGIFT